VFIYFIMGSAILEAKPPSASTPYGRGKTVAVIGSGISGILAAAHLLKQGLSVTVYERSNAAGGIWRYDSRVSHDPPHPNHKPSLGDYHVSKPGEFDADAEVVSPTSITQEAKENEISDIQFSPPGPCYAGLITNMPISLMVTSLASWPEGTELFPKHPDVLKYVLNLAKTYGVDKITQYRTRVDEVKKISDGSNCKWQLRSVTFDPNETNLVENTSLFDLVVVASGHFNMPRIPDIPGLGEWKTAYPGRVIHSKQYRDPQRYHGKNIIVLGGSIAAADIIKELCAAGAANVYGAPGVDLRGCALPRSMIHPDVRGVSGVDCFSLLEAPVVNHDHHTHSSRTDDMAEEPVPGTVTFKDGRTLTSIHHVILATGYVVSYPFLPHLTSDTIPARSPDHTNNTKSVGNNLVVTAEGVVTHNLHKDIFYIPDPTLAFVGVPTHVATFSLFDFQAQAVARVFAGTAAPLPTEEEMRREYNERVQQRGLYRTFNSLYWEEREIKYVKSLVEMVNGPDNGMGRARHDGREGEDSEGKAKDRQGPMMGHSAEWLRAYEAFSKMAEGSRWLCGSCDLLCPI